VFAFRGCFVGFLPGRSVHPSVWSTTFFDFRSVASTMGNFCGQASLLEGLVGQLAGRGVWAPWQMAVEPLEDAPGFTSTIVDATT